MPNAQDCHIVRAGNPIDDDVGWHRDQFSCVPLASGSSAAGKHRQAVAGEQKLAAHPSGRDRVVGRDVLDDPPDIGQGPGTPDDGQQLARLWGRRVELALREAKQPEANLLMRYRSRVRIRLGDGCRESAGFCRGFVVVDQGGWSSHANNISHRPPGCTCYRPRLPILPATHSGISTWPPITPE